MPSQTKSPRFGLSSGTGTPWVAPQCVGFNDGVTFASCNVLSPTSLTAYLIGYDFGFNIPSTANIDGVITSFRRQIIVPSASTSGSNLPYLPTGCAALSPQYTYISSVTPVVYTVSVQLFRGPFIGLNYNPMNQWGADLNADTAGSAIFSWNANLTANLINQSGFGFGIAARVDTDPAILYAQNFSMTVFYS
jgi:hypothetical protein